MHSKHWQLIQLLILQQINPILSYQYSLDHQYFQCQNITHLMKQHSKTTSDDSIVLQLSKIPKKLYTNYARVHMGTELNNALIFLVSPCFSKPEELSYNELCSVLINHFTVLEINILKASNFVLLSNKKRQASLILFYASSKILLTANKPNF